MIKKRVNLRTIFDLRPRNLSLEFCRHKEYIFHEIPSIFGIHKKLFKNFLSDQLVNKILYIVTYNVILHISQQHTRLSC